MRIIHELNQLEVGGAERVVLGIAKHDKQNTHTVYSYIDGPMREIFEKAGVNVLIDSKEKTHDLDVEMIHIHTGGDQSRMAQAVKNAIPTIETVHSPVASAVRDEWVSWRVGVSKVVSGMNRKCVTIYNGVDVTRLEAGTGNLRARLGIPDDAFVIGRLGRVGYDKLVDQFLLACWFASMTGLIPNLHVLVVGNEAKDSRGYLAKMKVMAASLPLKNCHFIPGTEDVGDAYRTMDIFMYPSPTEGFGLVYFEAMACGVPVLTWKTPLTKELLFGCAWLSAENTARSLADDLAYFAMNKFVRDNFAQKGKEVAYRGFTEEVMSFHYQALYKKLYDTAYAGLEPVANA